MQFRYVVWRRPTTICSRKIVRTTGASSNINNVFRNINNIINSFAATQVSLPSFPTNVNRKKNQNHPHVAATPKINYPREAQDMENSSSHEWNQLFVAGVAVSFLHAFHSFSFLMFMLHQHRIERLHQHKESNRIEGTLLCWKWDWWRVLWSL